MSLRLVPLAVVALSLLAPMALAQDLAAPDLPRVAGGLVAQVEGQVNELTGGGEPGDGFGEDQPRDPGRGGNPGDDFGRLVVEELAENWAVATGAALLAAALGTVGFVLATRYVDPKEALENPQRAMLYGYVKGNPGVHLKQLSDTFDMKTSTVLWHVRKLERAELLKSGKANGYRVFYPTAGGVEAKRISSAIAALSNGNARQLFDYVIANPGVGQRHLGRALAINPGTVRWHMRKLRDAGLVAELLQERNSSYYASELGLKAAKHVIGLPVQVRAPSPAPVLSGEAMPSPAE